MQPIKTELTKLLNITTPIVSAPMGYPWSANLAVAVTKAGGFGMTGAAFETPEKLHETLGDIRKKLNVPSGQPLPIGFGLLGWILDRTEVSEEPRIPAVLEEMPAVIYFSFGENLGPYVQTVRDYDSKRTHKTLIWVCVNSVEEALVAVNEWKVDVIVAQGIESGGHGASKAPSTSILVTAILAALPSGPPIIAAGGIATGAQAASFLTLGASGVILGTRLLFTPECGYTPTEKSILLNADLNSTRRGMCFDEVNRTMGWPEGVDGRAIANDVWRDNEEGLALEERLKLFDEGRAHGDKERAIVWAGAAAGLTKEITSASEVIKELHENAVKALQRACSLV